MSTPSTGPATGPDGGADHPSSELATQYDALHQAVGAYVLPRDVVRVSGPDATSYLQGQCSQDVDALSVGTAVDALLLSPQGKVEALVRISRLGDDEFAVDTDAGFGPVVTARLLRFRLRVKVEIEALAWICLALRGPAAADALRAADSPSGLGSDSEHAPTLVLSVEWPGLTGFDLLGPEPAGGVDTWIPGGAVRCHQAAWEAARIEAGVPVNGREITEGTIAAEVGLVERTVSFTKGCFTGQELVARLDARGSKVARRLSGLVLAPSDPPVPDFNGAEALVGAVVRTADQAHEVGHLSSVAWSPRLQAPVALATLHRRVTPPEAVQVAWEDSGGTHVAEAAARPLPL
jgi:folate-binding protein YgfZ